MPTRSGRGKRDGGRERFDHFSGDARGRFEVGDHEESAEEQICAGEEHVGRVHAALQDEDNDSSARLGDRRYKA